MEWIGIGFLLALGAWLFTVVLDWFRRHPIVVANITIGALSLFMLAIVVAAFLWDRWAGMVSLVLVSRALWSVTAKPPAEPSQPSA